MLSRIQKRMQHHHLPYQSDDKGPDTNGALLLWQATLVDPID